MRYIVGWLLIGSVVLWTCTLALANEEHEHAAPSSAHEEHAHGASGAQTLTGEVVDVFCYLSHPAEGLGPKHAGCAKKCIKSGLPVAIKVGNQLYLATMADHNPANQQLAELAGRQVTVRGNVMEKDGQRLISIANVEQAN